MTDGSDPDIAEWLRQRLDPTAADASVAGARIHARAVNERSRGLLQDPPVPAASATSSWRRPEVRCPSA